METSADKTKLAQFDEFFSIDYYFNINATTLNSENLPSYEQFLN